VTWIESHTTIGHHPKTRKLARRLNVSIPEAVGLLHLLWHWAIEYAADGDLSKHEPEDMAVGAQFDGDPHVFLEALVATGFVDRGDDGIVLHDWWDFAGRLVAAKSSGSFGNHKRWHEGRGIVDPTCSYCAGESGARSGANRGARSGPNPHHLPTIPTHPPSPTDDGDESKLKTALKDEGFSSDAIEHAIGKLHNNGHRVTSTLAYCRKVATNYATEKADEDRRRIESERVASCQRCDEKGRVVDERGDVVFDASDAIVYCDHAAKAEAS
jgi:hypothetical protein